MDNQNSRNNNFTMNYYVEFINPDEISEHTESNECNTDPIGNGTNYRSQERIAFLLRKERGGDEQCGNLEMVKCELCGKCFENESKLRDHISVGHFDCHLNYEYLLCEKSETVVEIDIDSCTETDIKITPTKYKVKSVRCSDRPPHVCSYCYKPFRRKSWLVQHEGIHKDERPYACTVCKKAFKQRSGLCQHRLIHKNDRRHICTICSTGFINKSALTQHKAVHSTERPYICRICDRSFKQRSGLAQHKAIHSEERPHECRVCGIGFKQRSCLFQHEASHFKREHTYARW